ncbi:hypothetical protein NBO_376g0006 [Nosema bombycis CQ1]|uniref:Uncharacterized protein n=1 Tax=Nosema bombycis (strain CQ1 / CVCC 102059) TaxID=578461 RepID=R0MIU1_NOSB1|nr:hypothetical protein NBO_376g0006 [Nosema bombycis CQ1]|eukprot:EOB12718.1 hypothetical protein NBO_376g0006 [Nosema bombycis CQ1]
MKCLRKEYDGIFKEILEFFQVMTRSVLFLRTHLLDYQNIELLFDVLDNCEGFGEDSKVSKGDLRDDSKEDWKEVDCSEVLPHTEHPLLNKSILKLIVNLVLDYGNYKKKFVENGGFDKILRHKQTHPVEVLMIFKNFLYDTHWQAKEQFLSSTNPDFLNFFFKIYETTKDPRVIEILFNLIRNLVCDDSLELILVTYTDLIPKVFKYLEKFSEENNEKVLIQILYTIGNLSANSPAFRDLIFEGKRMDSLKKSCTTRDLSLAFVWIIINVSWKDNGYEERVSKLKEFGIKEFLLKMTGGDSVLMDKINTALDNIK